VSSGWFRRFESELWQTSGVLLADDGYALAIDPGITPGEIAAIDALAAENGASVEAILITHVHADHTCGIGHFPRAEVGMGPLAAAEVANGAAAESVRAFGAREGFEYAGEPRCDRILVPGVAAAAGPFTIETMALPGHTDGGLAYRERRLGLLVVGDYLSSYEFPFVYHSTAAYRASLLSLLDVLRNDPPALVIPGHGPAHEPETAITVAEADLAYLLALRGAVRAALDAGADPEAAAAAGAAVPPPRPAGEIGSQREGNGRCQTAEFIAGIG
jgi:hydroxyacylglutathione hydrolase